jgi:hypothetical protein
MTAAISSERKRRDAASVCILTTKLTCPKNGPNSKILLPTVAVSAETCRLKGEMIPFQVLNYQGGKRRRFGAMGPKMGHPKLLWVRLLWFRPDHASQIRNHFDG